MVINQRHLIFTIGGFLGGYDVDDFLTEQNNIGNQEDDEVGVQSFFVGV